MQGQLLCKEGQRRAHSALWSHPQTAWPLAVAPKERPSLWGTFLTHPGGSSPTVHGWVFGGHIWGAWAGVLKNYLFVPHLFFAKKKKVLSIAPVLLFDEITLTAPMPNLRRPVFVCTRRCNAVRESSLRVPGSGNSDSIMCKIARLQSVQRFHTRHPRVYRLLPHSVSLLCFHTRCLCTVSTLTVYTQHHVVCYMSAKLLLALKTLAQEQCYAGPLPIHKLKLVIAQRYDTMT